MRCIPQYKNILLAWRTLVTTERHGIFDRRRGDSLIWCPPTHTSKDKTRTPSRLSAWGWAITSRDVRQGCVSDRWGSKSEGKWLADKCGFVYCQVVLLVNTWTICSYYYYYYWRPWCFTTTWDMVYLNITQAYIYRQRYYGVGAKHTESISTMKILSVP